MLKKEGELLLLSSTYSHLLLGQWRKVGRILGVRLPARGAQLVLVGADAVPAEAADLVAARARIEVEIVHLYGLHAQRTFGRLIRAVVERVHLDSLARSLSLSLCLTCAQRNCCVCVFVVTQV